MDNPVTVTLKCHHKKTLAVIFFCCCCFSLPNLPKWIVGKIVGSAVVLGKKKAYFAIKEMLKSERGGELGPTKEEFSLQQITLGRGYIKSSKGRKRTLRIFRKMLGCRVRTAGGKGAGSCTRPMFFNLRNLGGFQSPEFPSQKGCSPHIVKFLKLRNTALGVHLLRPDFSYHR